MWNLDASTFVSGVDTAFWFIFGVGAFFLIGIAAFMIYCVFRFSKKRNPEATQIHGSWLLEFIWTAIPTLLVLVMFYLGWEGFIQMRRIPDNTLDIQVNAGKWYWKFTYPNGLEQTNDQGLTVPMNKPVKLTLVSDDVVHSFYVPAFRLKLDVMPKPEGAHYNETWFQAIKTGDFNLLCAEYCGVDHAQMLSMVHVIPDSEFNAWYDKATSELQQARKDNPGEMVYKSKGCFACHTVNGEKGIGPSFKGLYGKEEIVLTGGQERQITVNDEYIRNSLKNPTSDIVKGFQPLMPPLPLTDEEVEHLISYLKSLK